MKMRLVGMSILSILLRLGPGYHTSSPWKGEERGMACSIHVEKGCIGEERKKGDLTRKNWWSRGRDNRREVSLTLAIESSD
jgi:hypothetical protein